MKWNVGDDKALPRHGDSRERMFRSSKQKIVSFIIACQLGVYDLHLMVVRCNGRVRFRNLQSTLEMLVHRSRIDHDSENGKTKPLEIFFNFPLRAQLQQ